MADTIHIRIPVDDGDSIMAISTHKWLAGEGSIDSMRVEFMWETQPDPEPFLPSPSATDSFIIIVGLFIAVAMALLWKAGR